MDDAGARGPQGGANLHREGASGERPLERENQTVIACALCAFVTPTHPTLGMLIAVRDVNCHACLLRMCLGVCVRSSGTVSIVVGLYLLSKLVLRFRSRELCSRHKQNRIEVTHV